jgi:hypothetical protein
MNINMEKIKEFIALREELYAAGVIGVDMYADDVHVKKQALLALPDLKIESGYSEEYPYFVSTVVDGIKLHCILSEEEFAKYPQLQEYMIEDVDLSGGGDHAA